MIGMSRTSRTARAAMVLASVTLVVAGAGASAQSPDPADASAPPMASGAPASTAPVGPLAVSGAWARVSPMMQMAGAAYLTIHNAGITDDALVGVTSPAASVVETHQTSADASGEMMMAPVDAIPVPAGGDAVLAPGGYHIMLIELVAPLVDGQTIELSLTFQSGITLDVTAEVRSGPPMPMGSMAPASIAPMGSAG